MGLPPPGPGLGRQALSRGRQTLHPGSTSLAAGFYYWLLRFNKNFWGMPMEEESTGTPPDLGPSPLPTSRGWSPA